MSETDYGVAPTTAELVTLDREVRAACAGISVAAQREIDFRPASQAIPASPAKLMAVFFRDLGAELVLNGSRMVRQHLTTDAATQAEGTFNQ